MDGLLVMATDWAQVWNDTWKIATSVIVLFAILGWWNWLMKNLGSF